MVSSGAVWGSGGRQPFTAKCMVEESCSSLDILDAKRKGLSFHYPL